MITVSDNNNNFLTPLVWLCVYVTIQIHKYQVIIIVRNVTIFKEIVGNNKWTKCKIMINVIFPLS